MIELTVIGFVAGIVVGISPCILPVLPVILVAGATTSAAAGRTRRPRARAVAVVGGLVVSFSFLILAGSELLSLLHLPQDFLRDTGIALLVLVGLGFLVAPLEALLQRPFARISWGDPSGRAGGFVVGLALGVLFVPCAGPVLAAITVVGATHRVGFTAVALTVAFAVGAAIPLLIVALAGSELVQRVKVLRQRGPLVRQLSGVVLIVMALAIGSNMFAGLQRDIPGYTNALQSAVEGSSSVRQQLSSLTGNSHSSLAKCNDKTTALVNCGKAPAIRGISAWLNTPGGKPLELSKLRGEVVLIDFWTYSCINCQRALPHVEAWYKAYAKYGFVVVGVHTPEFSFEHVISNVQMEAAQLGVHYPVAIDNNYATWDAYDNEGWPADYLVDASGTVRYISIGEGDYGTTQTAIRKLLARAGARRLGAKARAHGVITPSQLVTPETYLGTERAQDWIDPPVPGARAYGSPSFPFPLNEFAYGGTWSIGPQQALAISGARILAEVQAKNVYIVLSPPAHGAGRVAISVDGHATKTLDVTQQRLYQVAHFATDSVHAIELRFSPGTSGYSFTFG